MAMRADPIRPIYEMPGHAHYGPVRRLWMMFEQLFADRGGVRAIEIAIEAHRERQRVEAAKRWDTHLAWLLDAGLTEPDAQRVVMGQMLVAAEWLR